METALDAPATPTWPRNRGSCSCCRTRTRYRASLRFETVRRRSLNACATSDRATEAIVCSSSAVRGPPNRDDLYVTVSNQNPRTTARLGTQPPTIAAQATDATSAQAVTQRAKIRDTRAIYALGVSAAHTRCSELAAIETGWRTVSASLEDQALLEADPFGSGRVQ
jgi:hypothetical protein